MEKHDPGKTVQYMVRTNTVIQIGLLKVPYFTFFLYYFGLQWSSHAHQLKHWTAPQHIEPPVYTLSSYTCLL